MLRHRLFKLLISSSLTACALTAAARGGPQTMPPPRLTLPDAAPLTVWRPPVLQVAGAQQPVRLQALKIDVEIVDGLAETRVQMEFFNPNKRVLEGELQFPLSAGQAVTGFALDVGGKLRDAVPVDKARAQQVFEDIARQQVDPGLLQTTLGNNYKLRIYPLNPRATRAVALRITQAVGAQLQLPLAYAARVDDFELNMRYPVAAQMPRIVGANPLGLQFVPVSGGGFSATVRGRDLALPAAGLQLRGDANASVTASTQRIDAEEFFAFSLLLGDAMQARPLPERIMLVWDASASGAARAHDKEFALLDAYFKRAGNMQVNLIRVADTAAAPQAFVVRGGSWSALKQALQATVYDGASNLAAVRHDGATQEALWFTDGLANYGETWQLKFPVPVYAINSAVSGNPAALQALAQRSGGTMIDLIEANAAQASKALLNRGVKLLNTDAAGARDLVVQTEAGRLAVSGVLTSAQSRVVVKLQQADGSVTTRTVVVNSGQNVSGLAAAQWARGKLADLAADARTNRQAIRQIGKRFGIVTPETSLLVLERVEDYVRHEITPPAELRDSYEHLLAQSVQQKRQTEEQRIAAVVKRFEARVAWWEKDFPKDAPLKVLQDKAASSDARAGNLSAATARPRSDAPPPPASPMTAAAPAPAADAALFMSRSSLAEKKSDAGSPMQASIAIQLKPAAADAPYLKRLQAAPRDQWEKIYLDERRTYQRSAGFYLDVADFFLEQKMPEIALRVLSNLAEMDLENRQILRLLAYRLLQAGQVSVAVPVLERVLDLAPDEPQSHRDLALALAQAGQPQRALDRLYEVVTGVWSERFPDIDLIALSELNAIADQAARKGMPLDTSKMQVRLLRHLPLDLRVVLSWDADNTDVDLHVIDPNGEEVFFSHRQSYQGGAITRDATGGYGPEEFALKRAKPGKYRIEANFYGHRQQILVNSTGLMLWLSSHFGTAQQQDQRTTRQVKSAGGERLLIGEFVVQ